MTVSSRVVLLPSITEAASMLGSSIMVWSEGQMSSINISNTYVCTVEPGLSDLSAQPTNNISVLTNDIFSRHLRVLKLLEELIQTVSFSALSSLPELIWHQGRQAACEHLIGDVQQLGSDGKNAVCISECKRTKTCLNKLEIAKSFDRVPKQRNRDLVNYAATRFYSVFCRGKVWA